MVNNPAINTLIYESIFDFPLKREEIWKFLISDKKVSRGNFEKLLSDKRIVFDKKTNLYSLTKNNKIFTGRLFREKTSFEKNKIAISAAYLLSKIPTVNLVGVSGSLAQYSARQNDDIDIFIICKKNSVWTTRFFAVIILKLKNIYRTDKDINNKICLNMLTDSYSFSEKRKDLYDAFEIAQLRPIYSRNNTYEEFLDHNKWINIYLPNFFYIKNKTIGEEIKESRLNTLLLYTLPTFEKITKLIQKIYMKKITTETVTDHFLAFHPRDFKSEILGKYEDLIKQY
jgi:hypothetical protein